MIDHEMTHNEESVCPRCGAEALWRFSDNEEDRVEIDCVDCGPYSMTRSEFEASELNRGEEEVREA